MKIIEAKKTTKKGRRPAQTELKKKVQQSTHAPTAKTRLIIRLSILNTLK